MCALLITTWTENYGDANAPASQSFISAWKAIKAGKQTPSILILDHRARLDRKIVLLGIVQSLFEASMYVFVLEWTPALTQALDKTDIDKTDNKHPPIPHGMPVRTEPWHTSAARLGYVFASYMVSMMIGSNLFKALSNYTTPESFMRCVLCSCTSTGESSAFLDRSW